jgi:ABC-type Mn2+/Zn2+ transport system permease subunit
VAWARLVAFEVAIWAALYGMYLAVRGVTMGSPKEAFSHAAMRC